MSFNPDLLGLLRCPQSHQPLHLADSNLVVRFNKSIDAGHILDATSQTVLDRVDALLVREDGQLAYCIRDDIADLLVESALRLDQLQ